MGKKTIKERIICEMTRQQVRPADLYNSVNKISPLTMATLYRYVSPSNKWVGRPSLSIVAAIALSLNVKVESILDESLLAQWEQVRDTFKLNNLVIECSENTSNLIQVMISNDNECCSVEAFRAGDIVLYEPCTECFSGLAVVSDGINTHVVDMDKPETVTYKFKVIGKPVKLLRDCF